ncbi:MAG TPA: PaaX family transcriptional regulator C-terminal domain-containing protein, partial [Microbacterium sp.]|nr:PaaX family transcriptional regulator C-terminal domain-containing protein [Microbacterium sp.]
RDEHLAFIATWSDPATATQAGSPLAARAMLVADWLALLGADPRLPRAFMDDDWPADRSYEVYWTARKRLDAASTAQFAALAAEGAQRRAS